MFWWLFWEMTAMPHGQFHRALSFGKIIHSFYRILKPHYAQHTVMYHLIMHTYPWRHYFSTKWRTAFLLNVLACYFTGQFGFFPRSICLPHQQTSSLQQDSWPASVIHFWSLHNCPLKLHSIPAVCLRVNTANLTVLCMHIWIKNSAPPTVITVWVCLWTGFYIKLAWRNQCCASKIWQKTFINTISNHTVMSFSEKNLKNLQTLWVTMFT